MVKSISRPIMRLLLTADLRYRLLWFKWLEAQAVQYEVVAISGDLLDVFHKEPLRRQVNRATNWLRTLASKSSVGVCSGNHDTIDIPTERLSCPTPAWLAELDPILTIDGKSAIIRDQIIMTSLSFIATGAQKRPILAAGRRLRDERALPWIVLHHHPPSFHEGIGQEELTAGRLIKRRHRSPSKTNRGRASSPLPARSPTDYRRLQGSPGNGLASG